MDDGIHLGFGFKVKQLSGRLAALPPMIAVIFALPRLNPAVETADTKTFFPDCSFGNF